MWVPGEPAPGGSKKPFTYKCKKTGKIRASMAPDSSRTKPWMNNVAHFCRAQWRLPVVDGPVRLGVVFYMDRPKSHYRTGKYAGQLRQDAPRLHTIAPDTTKLLRSTEDAMKGIVWRDDCLVCDQSAVKVYSDTGKPGALISVFVPADVQDGLF
jgi:Holliday junction resolvase RusA-like endonuclease